MVSDLINEYFCLKKSSEWEQNGRYEYTLYEALKIEQKKRIYTHEFINESEFLELLSYIEEYNLVQQVSLKYKDTWSLNNLPTGEKYFLKKKLINFESGLSNANLITQIKIRILVYKFMAGLGRFQPRNFSFPCILFDNQYMENLKFKNKTTRISEALEYGLFYDNEVCEYNFINKLNIQVNKGDSLEDIFELIDNENRRRKKACIDQIHESDLITLNIKMEMESQNDLRVLFYLMNTHNNLQVTISGNLKFTELSGLTFN